VTSTCSNLCSSYSKASTTCTPPKWSTATSSHPTCCSTRSATWRSVTSVSAGVSTHFPNSATRSRWWRGGSAHRRWSSTPKSTTNSWTCGRSAASLL